MDRPIIKVKPLHIEGNNNEGFIETIVDEDENNVEVIPADRDEDSEIELEVIEVPDTVPQTNSVTKFVQEEPRQMKKLTRKERRKEFRRKSSTMDIFGEVAVASVDFPLLSFTNRSDNDVLFLPPPPNVLVKCQLNKTNPKDRTNFLTSFTFSLQIFKEPKSRKVQKEDDCGWKDKFDLKILMTARYKKKSKTPNYIISTDFDDIRSNNSGTIGKLRGNFAGTRFKFWKKIQTTKGNDDDGDDDDEAEDEGKSCEMNSEDSEENTKKFQLLGSCLYKTTKVNFKRPPRIFLYIPIFNEDSKSYLETELPIEVLPNESSSDDFFLMDSIAPTYNKDRKCYSLDFGGRVKDSSVKNYALKMVVNGEEKRVFQFGKSGDHFIVDFTWPLCAYQAFCLALTAMQRKFA